MARQIKWRFRLDGAPLDPDQVVLADPSETYGLRRDDTGEVLIAPGTALTRDAAGEYSIDLTEPAPRLDYTAVLRITVGAETHHVERRIAGSPGLSTGRENPLYGPLEGIRELLAASPTFQTLVGAANATEARAHIYLAEIDSPRDKRPFGLVDHGDEWNANRSSAANTYRATGEVMVEIEADVPADHTTAAQTRQWMLQLIGDILADLLRLANTGQYLTIDTASVFEAVRADELEISGQGDFVLAILRLTWSP